jgi:Tol biopolymer transport system component
MKSRWWIFAVSTLLLAMAVAGCAAMAPAGRQAASPREPVTYQRVTIAEAGLDLDAPSRWQRVEPGWAWASTDGDGYRVGVSWADLEPPMEPEVVMLPNPSLVLDSVPVDLGWASGHRLTVEVYAPAVSGGGSDLAPSVKAVERHTVVVVNQGYGRRVYDFYASAPTADALATLDPVLDAMVSSVELRVPSVLLTQVPVTVLPPGLVFSAAGGLWRVDADGQPTLLSADPNANLSPDARQSGIGGQELAFRGDGGLVSDDIWIADLSTGKERNLTNEAGRIECCPQWWPTRPDQIIFSSWPAGGADLGPTVGFLTTVQVDGSDYRVLGERWSIAHPAPAPDGRTIAYDQEGEAWLYQLDTGAEPFDPEAYGLSVQAMASPAWSPDGERLAWIVSVLDDGSQRMRIGVFDLQAGTSLLLGHPFEWHVGYWPPAPVWSPDGKWLAYDALPTAASPEQVLWVYRTDGGEEHFLGMGARPRWSPDGQWLSFNRGSDLFLAETGTWQPRKVELAAVGGLEGE